MHLCFPGQNIGVSHPYTVSLSLFSLSLRYGGVACLCSALRLSVTSGLTGSQRKKPPAVESISGSIDYSTRLVLGAESWISLLSIHPLTSSSSTSASSSLVSALFLPVFYDFSVRSFASSSALFPFVVSARERKSRLKAFEISSRSFESNHRRVSGSEGRGTYLGV